SVRLACDAAGDAVRVRVEDTGAGIAPEQLGRLFVPFARLGAEQTGIEGTGLGLALSSRLVEAMEGTLRLEATSSEGSTFTVELPLVESPLQRLERDGRAAPDAAAPSRPTATATLLYVEDNLANLALIETILLARPEVTLLTALQGRLGLDLAAEHRPDLVLLDLHLPDMQGDEVLARLRADPRTRDVPVIVISADATSGRIDRLLEAGAREYMTKPLDVDRFLAAVDGVLRERDTGRAG
ncbi:MAG TPA: response regulator, partial [Longimicrobiaceae bacterium]